MMDAMKENIFDVLIYLFENYLDDDINKIPDSEGIKSELIQAGFEKTEVSNAFNWLESLTEKSLIKPSIHPAFRIFCAQEEIKLNIECRNFLLFLEHSGILTPTTREIVIEKTMALQHKSLTLNELKWTVLMVLLSLTDDDMILSRMEDIVYDLAPTRLH
jgi:Smg protein